MPPKPACLSSILIAFHCGCRYLEYANMVCPYYPGLPPPAASDELLHSTPSAVPTHTATAAAETPQQQQGAAASEGPTAIVDGVCMDVRAVARSAHEARAALHTALQERAAAEVRATTAGRL